MRRALWLPLKAFTDITARLAWRTVGLTRTHLAVACWCAAVITGLGADVSMWVKGYRIVMLLVWALMLLAMGQRVRLVTGHQTQTPQEPQLGAVLGGFWLWHVAGSIISPDYELWMASVFTAAGYLKQPNDDKGEPVLHRAIRSALAVIRPPAHSPAGVRS